MLFREATPEDHDDVRDLCAHIWTERDSEYLDRVYPGWIQGDRKHTVVGVEDDRVVAIAQGVMLSSDEAWFQGLRVHPDVREQGVASQVLDRLNAWAVDSGATVSRNWVYSWNGAGMGISRSLGFQPATSFRWARPEPTADGNVEEIDRDPDEAWSIWSESDARDAFGGLALDRGESWALSRCTREDVHAADPIVVTEGPGRAMTYRAITFEREDTTTAVYAVSAWDHPAAAAALFDAIAIDANEIGANAIRVPVPEDPTLVSDTALARVGFDPEPHFIFEKRLT